MSPEHDFCVSQNHIISLLSQKMQRLKQHIARLKSNLHREVSKMKTEKQSHRKSRTRQLIQIGGIFQKSGLLDAFLIAPGDDLQDYENRDKTAKLLGFLSICFEKNAFNETNLERWRALGERLLKS